MMYTLSEISQPILNLKCARNTAVNQLGTSGLWVKKLVVLYQGLLKSERGIFVIADAIKMLSAENFLFVFMGEGPDQEKLKKYF